MQKTPILAQSLGFNLFSTPNKMPGFSFGLPAGAACPASKAMADEPDSICGQCYALRGNYTFKNVIKTGTDRLEWVRANLSNGEFVRVITNAIRFYYPTEQGLFRIHDRGDFFSNEYILAWYEIVKQFPGIKFWVPTREWIFPHKREALRKLASLPNITVKPSALLFGGMAEPEATAGLDASSGVCKTEAEAAALGFAVCPASIKANPSSCVENACFKCFDKGNKIPVAYLKH